MVDMRHDIWYSCSTINVCNMSWCQGTVAEQPGLIAIIFSTKSIRRFSIVHIRLFYALTNSSTHRRVECIEMSLVSSQDIPWPWRINVILLRKSNDNESRCGLFVWKSCLAWRTLYDKKCIIFRSTFRTVLYGMSVCQDTDTSTRYL